MDISSLLQDQNPWWIDHKYREPKGILARRAPFQRIRDYLGEVQSGRAAALLGPRQVGKTTLLLQLVDSLLAEEWPGPNITFFNFSDERIVDAISPRDVVAARPIGLSSTYPRIILLDEIQEAPKWRSWLKNAVDEARRGGPPIRFIVTGSAASSLSESGVESGQGRWDEIPVEGLSFAEYLTLYARSGGTAAETAERHPEAFDRYLAMGGFPEHVHAESLSEVRRRIREDIADRAIRRDLQKTGVEVERVRQLFAYLVKESGSIWSAAHRAQDLDANRKSVGDWLSLLEQTRLLARLERLDLPGARAKAQLRAQPKVHASEHSLISAFVPRRDPMDDGEIRGRVFEALVFRHLREVAYAHGGTISYLRLKDDLEIDFVFHGADATTGVEVTASAEIKLRKLTRLAETRKLGISRLLLVNGGLTRTRVGDVDVVPLHEFLLAPGRFLGVHP